MNRESLLFEDLSYRVLGCAFQVSRELGSGFYERIYQKALEIALRKEGLKYQRQRPIEIIFMGERLGYGFIDLVIEDRIVLELKSVNSIHPNLTRQVIQYLSASGLQVGFLLNFGSDAGLEYRRVVLSRGRRGLTDSRGT